MSRDPSPSSDEHLIQRALENERTAFDALVERHMGMVFAIACARLGDRERAEDLVQEVFLRAFLGLDRLREPSQFAAWVGRITRNLAISWQRRDSRTRRLVPLIDAELLPDLPDTHAKGARQQMETQEREAAVWQAILKLPPDEREAVLLHFTEELGPTEIAKRLDVHQTTITRRLQRALQQMRGLLEPMLREAAPALRVSPRVTTRTLGVIAGAAAMSAVSKAALAAKASQEVAALAQAPAAVAGFVASLEAAWAALISGLFLGGQAMATGKGIASVVAAAAVVGGGVYITHQSGADPTPTASSAAPFAVAAQMLDGSRTELPIISAEQSQRLQQDPRANVTPATVVREAGFMTVLPREFDLLVRGENLSPSTIFVTEQPPVTVPHPSMLAIFLREEVDEGELTPYPHEVRASTDEPGAWVITFPEPLPHDLLLIADGLSSARGFGLITDDSSEADALVARIDATMGETATPAPDPFAPAGEVSLTHSDMRAMAVGLETYFVDWNVYPPSALAGDTRNINRGDPLMSQMPSFASPCLTTPVMYLTGLFRDPSATTWATFAYERFEPNDPWRSHFGDYVLLSPGPDRDWDLLALTSVRRARIRPAVTTVINGVFDPTNGLMSNGDIVHSQRTSFLTQSTPVVALPTQRVSVQTATGETVEPGKMDTRSYYTLMSNLGQVLQAGNRLWTVSPTPLITLEEPVRAADEFEFHELDLTGDHRTPDMMRSLTPHITGGNGLWEVTFDHPLRGQLLLIVLPGIVQHRQDDAFWLMRVQGTPPPNPTRVAETEIQMRGQLDQLGL
jgi:RNA polymerase sigma-70 factor, ECF subfamily